MRTKRVAAAIIARGGRVLSGRRAGWPAPTGWEFPGGKVEPGETSEDAVRREAREELGCELGPLWYLDTVEHDYDDFHLSMDCYVCTLPEDEEPRPLVHDELRWLGPESLLDVEWLPADTDLVRGIGAMWGQLFDVDRL